MESPVPADESYWRLLPADIERLKRATGVSAVEHFTQLPSTNSYALSRLAEGSIASPWLVLTDQQQAGRGRGTNRWWSAHGALTFSLVLAREQIGAAEETACRLSLTTGIAVCEALHQLCPGLDTALKWPNDVYAQSRKICGILVETSTAAASRVVVGVGINVNNRLERAPAELRQRATSLIEITGYPIPLVTALTSVLQQIEGHLAWLREGAGELPQRWDAHCMLTGHRVEVATGSRRTSGTCRGIDRHGALLVETTDGITACSSGAVLSWQ